jgi:hypothetical protein
MERPDPFAIVAAREEFVAVACSVVAGWVRPAEAELDVLASEHLEAASRLKARPQRWLKLQVALRALLAAVVGDELGALVWLRKQEQRLVDAYVALEERESLSADERLRLRRQLVPGAFDRFSRVDRLIMLREEQGAYA